jgi:hypothetical protein
MGPQGLNVLAITHEDRMQVLKYLTQANSAPMTYSIGLGGLVGFTNPTNGIPYSWLIGADGKVVWQGHGLPSGKVIQEELKKVKVTDATKAARAGKAVAYADSLIAAKQLVRGIAVLDRVVKEYKGTDAARAAAEKKAAVEKDESLKKELTAQKDLDRITTGLEMPREKLKGKERDAKVIQLEGFLKKNAGTEAATLAEMWVKVMSEDWSKTVK